MSWIADFAGKAEELLNKIDQNAANVINDKKSRSAVHSRRSSEVPEIRFSANGDHHPSREKALHQPCATVINVEGTIEKPELQTSRPTMPKPKKEPQDDVLIQFLNSSSREFSPSSQHQHPNDALKNGDPDGEGHDSSQPTNRLTSGASDVSKQSARDKLSSKQVKVVMDGDVQLLQAEIQSLNQELRAVLARAKSAENGLADARSESSRLTLEVRSKELRIRDLEQDLVDLQQASESRMSEDEIQRLETSFKEVDHECKRLRDELNAQKESTEKALEAARTADSQSATVIRSLELETHRLQSLVDESNRQKGAENARVQELTAKVTALQEELSQAADQHEEYKVKVRKVLAEKEKLIAALRQQGHGGDDNGELVNDELKQVINERDLLREEVMQTCQDLAGAKQTIMELERQVLDQDNMFKKLQDEVSQALREERSKCVDGEQEIMRLKEELHRSETDWSSQRSSLLSTLTLREEDISKLKQRISDMARTSSNRDTSDPTHSTSRLNQLTEALLQKQALIEALSAEKTSLTLKIEQLETQQAESELFHRGHLRGHHPHHHNDYEPGLPNFLLETPHDTKVARGVKRAYTSIDRLSCRIGNTLRKYPTARIVSLIYMVMLQLWVFLILFQAAPEPSKR